MSGSPAGTATSTSAAAARWFPALLANGLVDELHLFVYPLALGAGPSLFEGGLEGKFTLAACEAYDNGAVHLAYQPAKQGWPYSVAVEARHETPTGSRDALEPASDLA